MSTDILIRAPVGLLPVLIFLFVLLYMDSYKLVGLKVVRGFGTAIMHE